MRDRRSTATGRRARRRLQRTSQLARAARVRSAPARYYLRRAHRYVPQDLAQALYSVSPDTTACPCPHCAGRPPVALSYHELMKHSVYCRAEEIEQWYGLDTHVAAQVLGGGVRRADITDQHRNAGAAYPKPREQQHRALA